MERQSTMLERKDVMIKNLNETICTLKETANGRSLKIEEQKRYVMELLSALESSKQSIKNTRTNEEVVKKHLSGQDEEIKKLKQELSKSMAERTRLEVTIQQLESKISVIKNELDGKKEELQSLLKESKSKETVVAELRTAQAKISDLEEMIKSRNREKDLMMTTYCRLIKENEKLHSELLKSRNDTRTDQRNEQQNIEHLGDRQRNLQNEIDRLVLLLTKTERQLEESRQNHFEAEEKRRKLELENEAMVAEKAGKRPGNSERLAVEGLKLQLGKAQNEKEALQHQLAEERFNVQKAEQMLKDERNKRIEKELIVKVQYAAKSYVIL